MKVVWCILSLLVLVGCAPVTVTEGTKPGTQKGAFFTTKDDVEVTGAAAIKGEKKVAIPVFRVGFTQTKGQGAHAKAMLSGKGTATVTAKTKLLGVENAVLQKITDDVYQTFVTDLKSKGFEVADIETLKRNEGYASMNAAENPKLVDNSVVGEVLFVAPTGMKLALMPGDEGAMSGFNAFSSNDPTKVVIKLLKDTNTSVLAVTYFVDYVNTGGSGGLFATRASVEIGPGLSVRAGSGYQFYGYEASKCVGYCPDTVAFVKLGQAVYSTEPFGEFKDVTQSDGAQVAMNVLTSAFSGSVRRWKEYEMNADPQKYQTITTQLLKDTNTKLVQALADKR